MEVETRLYCRDHLCITFLKMYQTIDLATPFCYVSDGLDSLLQPMDSQFHFPSHRLSKHVVGSQPHFPKANPTLGNNSRNFTCLIDKEIMKENPTLVHETAFDSIVLITFEPLNIGDCV